MARSFIHPSPKDFTVDGILYALSDPIRRGIVMRLLGTAGMSCNKACTELSPSTISFHHKILRESGLIRSEKIGVEVINLVRKQEMDRRFPGLLDSILKHHCGGK
jgi:DNA-binding transcriptional ArsR family regulator